MPEENFQTRCRGYRAQGFQFLGLQNEEKVVSYLFWGDGEIIREQQPIEEGAVHSIAQVFPLADFAERQMYRDCGVKALGNINLVRRED